MEKKYTMKTRLTKYKEGVERYNLFNSITYDELVFLCNSYLQALKIVNEVIHAYDEKHDRNKCKCGREIRRPGGRFYDNDEPDIVLNKYEKYINTSYNELCDIQQYYSACFNDATHEIKLLSA